MSSWLYIIGGFIVVIAIGYVCFLGYQHIMSL